MVVRPGLKAEISEPVFRGLKTPCSLRHGNIALRAGEFKFLVEAGVKALTEAGGEFEDAVVCHEDDDVARGIEDGGTDLAGLKMLIDFRAQFGVHLGIDVGGDVLPDVFAVDSHLPHPNKPLRLGAKLSSRGARCF